jgi:hypothetical protein
VALAGEAPFATEAAGWGAGDGSGSTTSARPLM